MSSSMAQLAADLDKTKFYQTLRYIKSILKGGLMDNTSKDGEENKYHEPEPDQNQ